MKKQQFASQVQAGIGRELLWPQQKSLYFCRRWADLILQMFEDGYSAEVTIKTVVPLMHEDEQKNNVESDLKSQTVKMWAYA